MWLPLLALATALAQDPPPDAEPDAVGPDIEQIDVWGEHAVRQYRAAIVRAMEDLGYRSRTRDGLVVFRPTQRWMGKVTLTRDGDLLFGRPVLAVKDVALQARTWDPGATTDPEDAAATSENLGPTWAASDPLDMDPAASSQVTPAFKFYFLPGQDVLSGSERQVLEQVGDEIAAYQRVLRTTRLQEMLYALPDQLDVLWTTGSAPAATGTLDTPAARRAWVLDYWATRSDTKEGHAVCAVVEKWLRATVMDSPDPVTPAEAADAEARRADGRRLDLGVSWTDPVE